MTRTDRVVQRKNIRETPRIIVCAGVFSSGSTWLFNAIVELLKSHHPDQRVAQFYADTVDNFPAEADTADWLVVKTHLPARSMQYLTASGKACLLVSVRDPRDAVVSLTQRFGFTGVGAMDRVRRSAACMTAICAGTDHLLLRFEDGFYDQPQTLDAVAAHVGLPRNAALANRISRALNRASVAARLIDLAASGAFGANPGPDTFDPQTLLHPGHVGDVRIGKFREELTEEQERFVVRSTSRFLGFFRYSVEVAPPALPAEGVLTFNGDTPGIACLGYGFASPEPGGVWTVANRACMFLRFADAVTEALDLTLSLVPSTHDAPRPKSVQGRVLVDGRIVGELAYGPGPIEAVEFGLRIEARRMQVRDGVELVFEFDNLASPEELGINGDVRRLGVLLTSIAYRAS